MPSRADRRDVTERALRLASLALLAWVAWLLLGGGRPSRAGAAWQESGDLAGPALAAWTIAPPADTLVTAFARAADAPVRDWLAALRAAGTAVRWRDEGVAPVALELVPVSDPAGGVRALVAAPAPAVVRLADGTGTLDSADAAGGGASFVVPGRPQRLSARVGGQTAGAAADTLARRRLAVLGRAGWETKFVIAALEERGWLVDARVAVAPGITVAQGAAFPLDTASHAAVVVLDSIEPAAAAAVARFVDRGGGLVLGGAAAAGPLGGIAPATHGGAVRPATQVFDARRPRRAIGYTALVPRPGAIGLERQGGHVVVAARRAGTGRVVETGYDETWRWRMSGDEALEAHGAWWAALVAAAAYRPEAGPSSGTGVTDPAPRAALHEALGGPTQFTGVPPRPGEPTRRLPPVAALLFAALLAEWASRRLRGAA